MKKLDSLDLLRGIAVLAVCFCHFGGALSSGNRLAEMFDYLHTYGKYGVHIFFVISGFVIPLSLNKSQYTINQYRCFLLKRVVRLHPPYLVALTISLLIGYAACVYRNVDFQETIYSIFLSVFYLHISEVNPVFWTLVVEAEYYIAIGIGYQWLIKQPKVSVSIGIPVLLLISKTPIADYIKLFYYIDFFLIGWVGFLIYTKKGCIKINIFGLILLLSVAFTFYEQPAAIASTLTIAVILFYRKSVPSIFMFLGKISYSIYLVHYPIGVKFINLSSRYVDSSLTWILFPIAMLISVWLGWLFWHFIEVPSAQRSSAMTYTPYFGVLNTNKVTD